MSPKTDRKVYQLCEQARRALTYAVCESSDPIVQDLYVLEVEPYPNASRLLVLVQTFETPAPPRPMILEALSEEKARLRCSVADAVHRKRVPELIFELAPAIEASM